MKKLERDIIQKLREKKLLQSDVSIDLRTSLVSSGLIDSFGLVEILEVLEIVTGLRIPSGRISPQDLDTVDSMIQVVHRWGKVV